ncbi:MAG: acyl-protein synthetase, partial [Psychrosphaera sp.]|nr:acyl-protein synthetase [Psychrosphaera sp.]
GIVGVSTFGRDHLYALDDNMAIDFAAIKGFIDKYPNQPILIFGFTFMIWQHFIEGLKQSDQKLDLSQAILLHSGGWKKLQRQALSNSDFKAALEQTTGITRVHNFYGMAEQVGSVLVECEHGYLHCSNFSDVHIKSTDDLSDVPSGQAGVVVIESLLPMSYPGHRLLTEDTATLVGEDDCRCGRLGKYLLVHNRVAHTQARGCSDVG